MSSEALNGINGFVEVVSDLDSMKFGASSISGQQSGFQRLPDDSIGTFALTLTNVVAGSAIQIETQAGAFVAFRTAASTSEAFTLSAYAGGNSLNNLRFKVRKGSGAPYYQPWETLAVANVGSQEIYVAQIPD